MQSMCRTSRIPNRSSRGVEVPRSCVLPSSVANKDAGSALDHGALLRSSETLGKNAAARNAAARNAAARNAAELTYLATPVKSVVLLPSTEVNYFVRSPKLGSATLGNIHALPDS
ncbi:hypothetical protein E5S67_03289 [Microcoleus sp. IPMA8]|uniref:Uncharacterized protein n=1 Tax=Microcoleus asticus IPMA8 TaxID=2563858 RepID=A0ABX2CZ17_9CYAN|nr:hypothetical protein [Microcoleus asticus IPMA8]